MEFETDDLEGVANVAVGVNEGRNSKYAVKWALQKFIPEGINLIKLLHVRPRLTLAQAQMRDDIVDAHRRDVEWKTNMMLLPFKQMCSEKQVEVETRIIEADDIPSAISQGVINFGINKLVIGASSRSALAKKFKADKPKSTRVMEAVPNFCTVFVASKGKLSYVRHSTSYCGGEYMQDDRSSSSISSSCRLSQDSSAYSEITETDSSSNVNSFYASNLHNQRSQALRSINQKFVDVNSRPNSNANAKTNSNPNTYSESSYHSARLSLGSEEDNMGSNSTGVEIQRGIPRDTGHRNIQSDYRRFKNSNNASASADLTIPSASENPVDVNFELERMKLELRHLQGLYEKAQSETVDASKKVNELNILREEDSVKLENLYLSEMKVQELAKEENKAREAAENEVDFVRKCTKKEVLDRKNVEVCAVREAEEKHRMQRVLISCEQQQYKIFDWEEIVSATSSFSSNLLIGAGANGKVYKGKIHHTTVAIKVLESSEVQTKQFQRELEILGRIRHPHLLLLVGACPDHGCLVYEYMENGNLSDRLKCKNDTEPLKWFHRYRIAWEIASALFFLHNTKPEAIIHRDLKPANILLDHNFVGKIGDVGLSTLLPADSFISNMRRNTDPVGTFFYIDPEYQRTGVISPKSDIYSLGMVILQLLTSKSPMGLAYTMETAIDEGDLDVILDSKAGEWPIEETQKLAQLALSCLELTSKDRPDLQTEILPLLENLKKVANAAEDGLIHSATSIPPNHFICPILQEVMHEPCVASDGYTYDRKAIETWFDINDKSPLTNLQLPNKNLIPNHSLLSAIKDWNPAI